MAYNDTAEKLEEALASVATTLAVSGVTVLTGQDDATKLMPNVICSVAGGEEEPAFSGNYRMTAEIAVVSNANDDTLATHRTRVATLFDGYRVNDLAATLSAAVTDFYVFGVGGSRVETERTEQAWLARLVLDVYCCAKDL